MIVGQYEYSLSLTSQFYYCGLPLRMDSYSRCQFNCSYCFANARGGNRGSRRLGVAAVSSIRNRLERLTSAPPRSVADEFLAKGQPIHLGGMSDPFQPIEADLGVTLELLKVLAEYRYPVVISTKSNLFKRDEYVEVLKRCRCIVQISLSSTNDSLLAQTDIGTPGPSALLKSIATLRAEGIPVACRIQPLLPMHEADAFDVIAACADIGVQHVAVEHLKLPVEKSWWGISSLSQSLHLDLAKYFTSHGALRVGREWILPVKERLERTIALRDYAHSRGISFGAADNDLLLLSDGKCCCSGVDLVSGFTRFFSHNFTEAARRGIPSNLISIRSLDRVWCPPKSISRHMNSHSRLPMQDGHGAGIRDYIRRNWNGSCNGNSPATFHGVVDSGEQDKDGFKLYTFTEEMRRILESGSLRWKGSTEDRPS